LARTKKKAKPKKIVPSKTISSFKEGLKYPWGVPRRLWNILWMLLPIMGLLVIMGYLQDRLWALLPMVGLVAISLLAIVGYFQRIVRAIVAGNKTHLPEFGSFWENAKKGFILLVKMIPLMLVYSLVYYTPFIGLWAGWFVEIFFMPYLMINLFVTDKFEESFNIRKTWDAVFGNVQEYLVAYVKTIGFIVIYMAASFIIVGIPCLAFAQVFFLAEFYANHS